MLFSLTVRELLASEDHIKHFNPTAKILNLSFYFPRRSVQQQIIFRAKKKPKPIRAEWDFQQTPLW